MASSGLPSGGKLVNRLSATFTTTATSMEPVELAAGDEVIIVVLFVHVDSYFKIATTLVGKRREA